MNKGTVLPEQARPRHNKILLTISSAVITVIKSLTPTKTILPNSARTTAVTIYIRYISNRLHAKCLHGSLLVLARNLSGFPIFLTPGVDGVSSLLASPCVVLITSRTKLFKISSKNFISVCSQLSLVTLFKLPLHSTLVPDHVVSRALN